MYRSPNPRCRSVRKPNCSSVGNDRPTGLEVFLLASNNGSSGLKFARSLGQHRPQDPHAAV